jgi:putative ABC transport system permease protein
VLSPRWRKVARDLWGNKARTVLVVLSIAVGVFAVGTLASTQVVLSDDLAANYDRSNPAGATITTKASATNTGRFGDGLLRTVRRMDGVAEADARRGVTVRMQLAPGQWRNLQLYAYPDPEDIRVGKVRPETGAWPPGKRQVVLERASMAYLGVANGDSLTVEVSDGRVLSLPVTGTAYDPSRLSPLLQSAVVGFISLDTLEWLGASRDFSELRITITGNSRDRAAILSVANQVRDQLERGGIAVAAVTVPANPGKHPADDIMQSILLILGALGFLSLFLSGFLVVNTMSAMVAQQMRQIGMMKAVGARADQVLGVYLGMVLVYGALALVVAVPAAVAGTLAMTGFTAGLINLDLMSSPLPLQVLALESVVSLVVPLAAAFVPLVAGTRTRVHAALNDYGLGQADFGSGTVDRVVTAISGHGWLSRPLLLSLRNTFRRKRRLALTLATLSLAGATFIGVFSVQASIRLTLQEALDYWNYDVDVSLRRNYRAGEISQAALAVAGVREVEAWGYAGALRVRPDGSDGEGMVVVALPADTQMLKPTLLAGRWLAPGDETAVVINTDVHDNEPDVEVGSELVLKIADRESTWKVVGVVRSVLDGPTAYAPYAYFSEVMRTVGRASRVEIVGDGSGAASQLAVARALDSGLAAAGLRVSQIQTTEQLRERATSQLNILIAFLLMMAVLLAFVGALGLAGMMGINVLERRREIGVMRAIGASDGAVARIFMAEGVLVGVLSWAIGTVAAVPLSMALGEAVGMATLKSPLSYAYSYEGAALWLALAAAIAALSTLVPARNAARLTVHEVLAYE